MNKALQGIGIAALFAWTALGAFAWLQTKEQVHITVQEDEGQGSVEIALLNDRLEALSSDFDSLVESLSGNFQLLADALREGGESQAVQSARVEERLRQLEDALPAALAARETAGALSAALARLESLALQPGDVAPRGASGATSEPVTGPVVEPVDERPVVEARPPATEPAPVSEPPAPKAPKSFLAFDLPSRDFRFEGSQRFEVLGDLSRVGFDAKSTLHDFTGVSERVSGEFTTDLAHPEAGILGRIEIRAASLGTALEGRDEAMHEHLAVEQHEVIAFEPTSFEPRTVDGETQRVEGTITGRMTIRGATRDVAMPVRAHVDDGRRLVIEGEMPLSLSDFEVPVPNKLGMISMEDEVRVWIHLRLRARAEATAKR